MAERDWLAWHDPYDDPSSSLSRRLDVVQRHLAAALDRCEDGTVSILSICAGQRRDLVGVLERHQRALDVTARLVELDDRNVAIAAGRAAQLDSSHIEVVEGDAGVTGAYVGIAPATIVLACGVCPDDLLRTLIGNHRAHAVCTSTVEVHRPSESGAVYAALVPLWR